MNREDQLKDFKKDVKAGLSVELLSELYDLTPEETKRGIEYVNRDWIECFLAGLVQFFRTIAFQIGMKIRMFKIRRLSSEVKKYDNKY